MREAGARRAARTLADLAARARSPRYPEGIAELLRALREAGAEDAARTLADPGADQASLADSWGVAELLRYCAWPGATTRPVPWRAWAPSGQSR